MTEQRFTIGSLVVLNSGGPLMTVEGFEPGGYRCVWFTGARLRRAVFGEAVLQAPALTALL